MLSKEVTATRLQNHLASSKIRVSENNISLCSRRKFSKLLTPHIDQNIPQSRAIQLKGECYTEYLAETYDALACYQYIYFLEHTQHQGLCGNFQNKGEWLQLASAGTAQVLAVTIAYWGSAIDQW